MKNKSRLVYNKVNTYSSMSGYIQFKGNVGYDFDAPNVTLTFDQIQNTDNAESGQIQVQFWNNQYSDGSGSCRLIAEFYLAKLSANSYYYDISRYLEMKADVTLPYLQLIVLEKYTDGWRWSDDRKFTKRVNNVNRRNAFRVSTIKNGIRTGAKIAGAIGTIGAMIFPPLAAVGVIGGAIASLFD